jgi:hypothetical protein
LLAARYRPEASAADIFFYEHSVLPKLLIFVVIAAFAPHIGQHNRLSRRDNGNPLLLVHTNVSISSSARPADRSRNPM